MSKEELNATAEATKFIEATRVSIPRIALKAADADDLGLGVLAREYAHIAKILDQALSLQIRTLKGNVPAGFTSTASAAPATEPVADTQRALFGSEVQQ